MKAFNCGMPRRSVPLFDPLLGGGLPAVETEQPAEPLATNDATGPGHFLLLPVDQSIPQTLMVSFVVVVCHVLEVAPPLVFPRHLQHQPRARAAPPRSRPPR